MARVMPEGIGPVSNADIKKLRSIMHYNAYGANLHCSS